MKNRMLSRLLTFFTLTALCILTSNCKKPTATQASLSSYQSSGIHSGLDIALRDTVRNLVSPLSDRKHSIENGSYVSTVTTVSVGSLISSSNSIIVPVNLVVAVTGRSSRSLPLNADAGGKNYFNGTAQAQIKLYKNSRGEADIKFNGITWPRRLTGTFSVWTNAILARQKVLAAARQEARASVNRNLPKVRAKVENLFSQQVTSAVQQMRPQFQNFFSDLKQATGLDSRFWGRSGVAHVGAAITTPTSPPPTMPNSREVSVAVNQKILENISARYLANQRQTPEQLKLNICKSFKATHMSGCRSTREHQPIKMEMIFADNPILFTMRDGKVRMDLKFKIAASTTKDFKITDSAYWNKIPATGEVPVGSGTIEVKDDTHAKRQVTHITPYVTVSVDYNKSTRQFVRESINVDIEKTEDQEGALFILSEFYRAALKAVISKQFHDIVPSWLGLPSVPLFVVKAGSKASYLVKDSSKDFGTRSGWLYSFYSKCQKSIDPLGIKVIQTKDSNGKNLLRVSSVTAHSPAARAEILTFGPGYKGPNHPGTELPENYKPEPGIKLGDFIYRLDNDTAGVKDPNLFNTLITSRSTIPDKRTITLRITRYLHLPGLEEGIWSNMDVKIHLKPTCGT